MSRGTSTTIPAITVTSTRTTTRRPDNPRLAATLTAAAVVWTLAAFAGVYTATLIPTAAAIAVAAFVARPRLRTGASRVLDAALLFALAVVCIQLIPLPPSLRVLVSPHAWTVEAALTVGGASVGARPISLDPESTWTALWLGALS